MAVVVKEASKTPLAIAALADNMAKTYLQYAQNETAQAQWEQEATWRNQDRERERQEQAREDERRSQLGDMADYIGGLSTDQFKGGELGRMGAQYAAGQGDDYSDYLADKKITSLLGQTAHDQQLMMEKMVLRSQYPNLSEGELDLMAAQRILTADNITLKNDGVTPGFGAYDKRELGSSSGGLRGIYGAEGEYENFGGNGSTTVGTPEGTGNIPSFSSVAAARAARDSGEISVGQTVFINGQQFTVDPFWEHMSGFTPVGPKPATYAGFTPVSNSSVPTQSYDGFSPVQQEEPELERSWSRAFGDTGAAFIGGVPRAAAGLVSLGSLVPGLHYAADPIASGLNKLGDYSDDLLLSDYQKFKNEEFSRALQSSALQLGEDASISDHINNIISQGGAAAEFIKDNPTQIFNLTASSLPMLFGGGVAAKGIKAGAGALGVGGGISRAGWGAIGEGAMAGGLVTNQIVDELEAQGVEGYDAGRLMGIPAGVATAAVGRLGGKVLGNSDIDTMVAQGIAKGESASGNVVTNALKGIVGEAGEEFVQGSAEQAFTNIGTGAPISEGVGGEAVAGAFAGGLLGGGGSLINSYATRNQSPFAEAMNRDQAQAEAQARLAEGQQAQAAQQAEMEAAALAEQEAAQATEQLPLGTPLAPGLEGLEGAGIGYENDIPITGTDTTQQVDVDPEVAAELEREAVPQMSAQEVAPTRQIAPEEADVITRGNFTPVEPTFEMGEDIVEQSESVDLKPAGGAGLRVKFRVPGRSISEPVVQKIVSTLGQYKNLPDDYPVYIMDQHPEGSTIEGMANYSAVTGKSKGVFLFIDALEKHAKESGLRIEDVIAEEIGVHAMQRLAPDTTRTKSDAFWKKVYKENKREIDKFWAENGRMGEVYSGMSTEMQAEEWMAKITRGEMADVTAGKRKTLSQLAQSYIRYVKATLQQLTGKQYTKEQVQRVIIKMAEGQRVRTVDQMSGEELSKWTGNKGFDKGGAVDKAVKERESMTSNEKLREYLPDEDVEQASIYHGATAKPGWPAKESMWRYTDKWDVRTVGKVKRFNWSGKSAEWLSKNDKKYEAMFNEMMLENVKASMSYIQARVNKNSLKLEAKFERLDKFSSGDTFKRGSVYVKVRRKDDPSVHFEFRISDHVQDLGEVHRRNGPITINMSNAQFKKFSDADKAKIDIGFKLLLDDKLYKMGALQAAIDYPINDGFSVKPLSSNKVLRNGNPANAREEELTRLTKGRGNLRFVRPDGTTPLDLRTREEVSGDRRNTFPLGSFTFNDFVSSKIIPANLLDTYFGDVERGKRLASMLEAAGDDTVGMFSYGGINWKQEGPSEFEVGKHSNMPELSVKEFHKIVRRVNLEPKHKRVWDVLDWYISDGDADELVARLEDLGDSYARYREDMIKELEDGGFIKDGKVTALRVENYFGTGWEKGQPAASFSLLPNWGMVRSYKGEENEPGRAAEGGMADPEKRNEKEPQSLLVREIPVDSILGLGYGFEGEIIADTSTVSMLSVQKYSSSETSIKQTAALLKRADLFEEGDRNLDLGGGKFDLGVKQLREYGVESRVHDKFNRDEAHNKKVEAWYENDPVDTVTIANVLNVIKEKEARAEVIQQAYDALRDGGKLYISVYYDSKKEAGETSKGWQNHMRIREYLPEVKKVFPNARVEKGIIVATKSDVSMASVSEADIKKLGIPVRDTKRGVGKRMGNDYYVHKSEEDAAREEFGETRYNNAKKKIPSDFSYDLIHTNAANGTIEFISSPDWDTASEPVRGEAVKVTTAGVTKVPPKSREQIYHHKWSFVGPDYKGFDVQESMQRSVDIGKALPKLKEKDPKITSRYGFKDTWESEVVPVIGMASVGGVNWKGKKKERKGLTAQQKRTEQASRKDLTKTIKPLFKFEDDGTLKMLSFGRPDGTNEQYQKKYGTPKTWSDVNWLEVLKGKGELIPQSTKDLINNWFTHINGKFIEKYGVDMTSASITGLGGLKNMNLYLKKRYEMMGKYLKVDNLAKEIYDTFNAAKPEEQSMVFDYLVGDIMYDQLVHYVSPEVAALARKTRLQIDENGQALVRMGVLKPETYFDNVNYESKFEKAQGYLPRMYLKHVLDKDAYGILSGGGSISGQGYLKKRQDLDQATRDLLGEIVNPGFLGANTISQVGRDIATAEFLDFISHFGNEDWILPDSMVKVSLVIENGVAKMVRNEKSGKRVSAHWLREEAAEMAAREAYFDLNTERGKAALKNSQSVRRDMERLAAENEAMLEGMGISVQSGKKNSMRGDKVVIKVPKGYTEKTWKQKRNQFRKVPDSKKYGVLAGMYVNKKIYNDLFGAKGTSKMEQHVAWRAASTMHSWFKIAKVPLNPPTTFRNIMSNIVLMSLDGMGIYEIGSNLVKAVSIMKSKSGRAWEAAEKYGVPLQTFTAQEMSKINKEFRNLAAENPKWKNNFFAIAKVITNVTDLYGTIETVMKVAIIEHWMSKGATEWEAVQRAQDTLFDYSLLNKSARLFRQVPIGAPFLSFSMLSLRRMGQVAARNPLRFAPWMGLMYLMWQVSALKEGVDDDDLDELHAMLPEYLRDKAKWMMVPLPMRDSDGKVQIMDLAYIYPFAMHIEILKQAMKGEFVEAMKDFGLGGAPLLQVSAAMMTGIDPFTGQKITNEYLDTKTKTMDRLVYAWSQFTPTFLGKDGPLKKMIDSYNGKVGSSKINFGEEKYTMGQSFARLFGINTYGVDPEKSVTANLIVMKYELDKTKQAYKSEIRDLVAQKGAAKTQEDKDKWQEKIDKRIAEMVVAVKALALDMEEMARLKNIHPNLKVKDLPNE